MPSILIEIGFISNQEEEEYMNSENGRRNCGQYFYSYKKLQGKAGIKGKPAAEVTDEAPKGF